MSETGTLKTSPFGSQGGRLLGSRMSMGERESDLPRLNICDLVVHSTLKRFLFLLLHDHLPRPRVEKGFSQNSFQKEKFLRPFTDL